MTVLDWASSSRRQQPRVKVEHLGGSALKLPSKPQKLCVVVMPEVTFQAKNSTSAPKGLNHRKMASPTSILRSHKTSKSQSIVPIPFSDCSDSEQEGGSSQVITEDYGQGYETEPEDDIELQEAPETLQHEQLIKSGYLLKKQERRNVRGKHWKKRWFVLRSTRFAYYKDDKEYELIRILDMSDVHAIAKVQLKSKDNVFGIVTPKRTYYIQANSKKELDDWLDALNKIKNQVQDESILDGEDEGSQGDSEEMASKQARISLPKRSSRLAFQEPPKTKPAPLTPTSMLEKPFVTSPIQPTGAIDIPKPSNQHNSHPSIEGFSYASVSSYNSVVSNANVPSTPSSPSGGQFLPERKDSSDPTASSEDDDALSVGMSKNVEVIPEEGENNRMIHAGYLYKLSKRYKTWKKRWFVLRNSTLTYYKNEKEREALRVIPLNVILDAIETDSISKSKQYCFKIITPKRVFVICASDDESEMNWLGALQMALNKTKEKLKEEDGDSKSSGYSIKA
ncbi:hypothetical protein G9A89_019457 [Geosiphon pyriformis]|nr:hypothetical protein G9A89_019457 [Geosiphon pyriformis]